MLLLLNLALAGPDDGHSDDFSSDRSRWIGGVVTEGVLRITDDTAEFPIGAMASFAGTLKVRLAEGERLGVQLTGARWEADYTRDGGVTLGSAGLLPLPTGHYAWEPDAEPVIVPEEPWDAGNALHAEVLYDDASATWFLFWTGELAPPGYGYRQIGLATSPDGVAWTRYAGNPVLTVDYDRTTVDGIHVHMPTVVKDGADWHMFYSCYQNDVGNRICHATSPDGYSWTPEGVALDKGSPGAFDEGSLRMPDVLIGPDGTWHMLYNGTDPEGHYGPTGYATSPDGWAWTKHGAITTDEDRLQGGGMFDGPYGVEQWWNCADAFCHSTAQWSDFTTWEDEPTPILTKGWSAWNDGYIQAPTPWLVGGTWHMWFNGYTYTENVERVGHARTVPTPGEWLTLDLAWDGATFTVTQNGVTQSMPLSSADGLLVEADGVAEIDRYTFTWTVPGPGDTGAPDTGDTGTPDTGDTGTPDTGDTDTADPDGEPTTDRDDTGGPAKDGGCGCSGGGTAAWNVALLGAVLVARRRIGARR